MVRSLAKFHPGRARFGRAGRRRAKPAASSASVAILGSATFDVLDIDDTSLLFDGLKVRVRARKGPLCDVEDVSGDLIPDLVCQFEDDPMNWTAALSATGTVTGTLLDGPSFEGTDSICVVP